MKPISSFIEPMQALPVAKLPEGDWLYEVKFDGYRALTFKDGKDVRLISRNNKPFNYPQVLDSLKLLAVEQVILDGEIVALDEKGRSSFSCFKFTKAPSKAFRLFITSSILSSLVCLRLASSSLPLRSRLLLRWFSLLVRLYIIRGTAAITVI
jgi:hypothetical protein